ncbi:FumA C-terminus/TtdB family hydratase beta subunit [Streptomyces tricolor]|uniref:FumA C-terminus/TtdB family hydratase beta subunit n=1 Tax=Streptomyces tricolor TaxID=68277 RepID=UPI0039DF5B27
MARILLWNGDEEEAVPYLEVAAEAGAAEAALRLGRIHRARAERWLRTAAEAGDGAAAHELGDLLVGPGHEDEAIRWYRRSAAAGHREVAGSLGSLLGRWGEQEAEEWLRYATAWGDARAANDLGVFLANVKKAAETEKEPLYRQAAEGGDASATVNLGVTLEFLGRDEEALSRGIYDAYTRLNLRYSQMAPLTMWEEKNTGSNLPAQIELYATDGGAYKFLFMAKGGGSANKSFLYQETKAVLNESSMMKFLEEKIRSLGTAACPPYHLAIVVGGTSAEYALKTAKYASAHYLDELPTEGSPLGHGFRDKELEEKVFELTQKIGIGAQFGGKYFCHDVRVVRLPRHGASCPVAIAVSCSADRQAVAKITAEGVFLEQLETDPARFLPDTTDEHLDESSDVVKIDLNQPMDTILAELTKYPVKTRLSLTGPLVVARDIAHAKIKERLDAGEEMPQYLKDHPVYYAGPAKTPEGYASGSFGPTTAGRMDSYVEQFQAAGGSKVMLAKGNRSKQVTDACNAHGGFYLGSIGGPAARLAQDCIKKVEVLEYEELGMEAVWKIEVEDFPAFIVVDDKGNDFFQDPAPQPTFTSIPVRGPGLA